MSSDSFRHNLYSGIRALTRVCDQSAYVFVSAVQGQGQQEEQEEQEMSMHDLLEAILEQEPFSGLVYY